MENEVEWVYERIGLYLELKKQPHRSNRHLAGELGKSEKWVRKWRKRIAAADKVTLRTFVGESRAPKTRPKQAPEAVKEVIGNLREELSEKYYGTQGYEIKDGKTTQRFWQEQCKSKGETLASFLYWLMHKMTFNRIIERPIIAKKEYQAIWPSVLAPVVPRIKVDVSESDSQRSWPWQNETREFDD